MTTAWFSHSEVLAWFKSLKVLNVQDEYFTHGNISHPPPSHPSFSSQVLKQHLGGDLESRPGKLGLGNSSSAVVQVYGCEGLQVCRCTGVHCTGVQCT